MAANKDHVLETQVDDNFSLDDIADLPGFVTPPDGAYVVHLEKGIEEKEINDAFYYEAAMTIVSNEEVTGKLDEGEELPKPGDIASIIFSRANKLGMGNFKIFVRPIAERFATTKVGEIRERSKGIDMMVIIKRKWNKDTERYNINVTRAELL